MKVIKKDGCKNWLLRASLLLLCITIMFSMTSCDLLNGLMHKEHSDKDADGLCDVCNEPVNTIGGCTEHLDSNCDGLCDECEASVTVNHDDRDDDGKCDKCDKCLTHRDINCNGECDSCGAAMDVIHTDEDSDGLCDKCEGCLGHTDGNCDGKCDACEDGMEIRHEDRDEDGLCDKCESCLGHTDDNCDGKCNVCGADVTVEHVDNDGNDKCDKCDTSLKTEHVDTDCDGRCDECSEEIGVSHKDSNNDALCDKCDKCLAHGDGNCDGKCDNCGKSADIVHADTDSDGVCNKCNKCIGDHSDEVADGECDRCGAFVPLRRYQADKTVSHSSGVTVYPAHFLKWSGVTYRGEYITYTIKIKNTGNVDLNVTVLDTVPKGTVYVEGCDGRSGESLSWLVSIPVGEERSVKYKVSVGIEKEIPECGYIEGDGATVEGVPVGCRDLFVEKTLNAIDQSYIEKAIKILSSSTWEGLEFAKHAYTVAFTNSGAIANLISGTPDEAINAIFSPNATLADAIAPGLYGGRSVTAAIAGAKGAPNSPVCSDDLISGDLIFVTEGINTRLYIVSDDVLYDITKTASKCSVESVLDNLREAEKYAVLRPSVTMTQFTPSDPDETIEVMNEYQTAIVATAETYLLRGESLQYEDVWFGLISQSGEHRWTHGEKSPEEYTRDEWGYVNCAVFTYDVYREALGYTLPNKMYTTANLSSYSESNGMRVFRFTNSTPGEYTEEYMLNIEREFMNTIEVGDIINVRRKTESGTSGHAMLYVGNGRFIHSGGSSYSVSGGVGYEIYEPTIRCHKVSDYIFNPTSVGGNPFRSSDEYGTTYVTELILVRPLNKFEGQIPENSAARVENMQGIRAEKLSSHPSSTTVNPGDLITFTFELFNVGMTDKTVDIYDKIPVGTEYVSGCDAFDSGELYWRVTVAPGETETVSYTVRVLEVADGTVIDGNDGKVGGVKHRCAAIRVKNTLTEAEQNAIIAAIASLKAEGTTLTKLELVNEIYKRALGINAIFTDTNIDRVVRDGEESIFATSTKVNNKKNLSMLRTDATYYSRMLVDHLYGGMRFDSSAKLYDRTKLLKEHNLIVGDVLIARSSSSANVYIYAGNGELLLLNSGIGDPVNFKTVSERIMYFGRDFAVVRPSFVIEK